MGSDFSERFPYRRIRLNQDEIGCILMQYALPTRFGSIELIVLWQYIFTVGNFIPSVDAYTYLWIAHPRNVCTARKGSHDVARKKVLF